MRTRGHQQAPEIEFSVLASNGEPLPAGHGVEVLLDDSTLGVFESSEGHVQVAGLSNGLHVITVQMAGCSAMNVGWRWRATAPFLYMFPLESAGDEDEWQLSWVRTIEFKQRLVILARVGSRTEKEAENAPIRVQASPHTHSGKETLAHASMRHANRAHGSFAVVANDSSAALNSRGHFRPQARAHVFCPCLEDTCLRHLIWGVYRC